MTLARAHSGVRKAAETVLHEALHQKFLVPCYDYLIDSDDYLRTLYGLPTGLAPENPGRFFNIGEEKLAGYLQAKYDTELFGVRVDGFRRPRPGRTSARTTQP